MPDIFKGKIRKLYLFQLIIRSYLYDLKRFWRHSGTVDFAKEFDKLESRIIAHCHSIEKGLSLAQPKPGFGKDVVNSLFSLLTIYTKKDHPRDGYAFQNAMACLNHYIQYCRGKDRDVAEIEKKFSSLQQQGECYNSGRTLLLHKDDILRCTKADFSEFNKTRFSIREFSQEPVLLETITKAVSMAQKAPSVCNRQSSRVYILSHRDTINNVFSTHTGNRGFGYLVDKLIIVTSDLAAFCGVGERNQAFIDAGIFSMSLMYSLHNMGLATCPLNWCTSKSNDIKLRKMIKIKESETIILLLAVGNYCDEFKVVKSTRKPTGEIMSII